MVNLVVDGLLSGSVDAITAHLGDLTDEQLTVLQDAEKAGAKRKTLLAAIKAEGAARAETAKAKLAEQAKAEAAKNGLTLYTQADVDAIRQGHGKRIAALEAKVNAAQGSTPATAKPGLPRKLALTGDADGELVTLAFTGRDDMTLDGLPDLVFDSSAFTRDPRSGVVTLNEAVQFPEGVRSSMVEKVWLVGENGQAAAVAPLVNPLTVGGGHTATIKAGWLAFAPEPDKAPAPVEPEKAEA